MTSGESRVRSFVTVAVLPKKTYTSGPSRSVRGAGGDGVSAADEARA